MQAKVECNELTVTYGTHIAADRVSFEVYEGEVFGLLGPNGAGKTSIIRALTTILEPASGSAVVAGFDLHDPAGIRSRIGVLPESAGYPKTETGVRYLQFFGEVFGLHRDEARDRAERLMSQLDLENDDRRISQYSRGMRQRLGICRALINDPDVLFLDEPTLGLDPAGKEFVVHHLAKVAAENGTAVLLCTHLIDEVERVCDRVAIMNKGSLIIDGSVDDVVRAAGTTGSLNDAFLALTKRQMAPR